MVSSGTSFKTLKSIYFDSENNPLLKVKIKISSQHQNRIPELEQAFLYAEKGGIKLVLQLANPSHWHDSCIEFHHIDNIGKSRKLGFISQHFKIILFTIKTK